MVNIVIVCGGVGRTANSCSYTTPMSAYNNVLATTLASPDHGTPPAPPSSAAGVVVNEERSVGADCMTRPMMTTPTPSICNWVSFLLRAVTVRSAVKNCASPAKMMVLMLAPSMLKPVYRGLWVTRGGHGGVVRMVEGRGGGYRLHDVACHGGVVNTTLNDAVNENIMTDDEW